MMQNQGNQDTEYTVTLYFHVLTTVIKGLIRDYWCLLGGEQIQLTSAQSKLNSH